MKSTVLIIPPNDPEAVQICRIAGAMGLPMIRSLQGHGASLDKENDLLKRVKEGGYERAVIVELPGPKTEEALRKAGVEVVIIDHHQYTGLDRARHPKTKRFLSSSLEQFLRLFRITPAKLTKLGFDARLVKAVGIQDRGYMWALVEEGYSWKDVREVFTYMDRLMDEVRDPEKEAEKLAAAQDAWNRRSTWKDFYIVEGRGDMALRVRISRVIALARRKPTPLIVLEPDRKFVYVQDSAYAQELFAAFGGFTFGLGGSWGYKNETGKPRVWLKDVQRVITEAKRTS
jgi:hypothetical protein